MSRREEKAYMPVLVFPNLTNHESKLLENFIRFADYRALTRIVEKDIHENPNEFGIPPSLIIATLTKLCGKKILRLVGVDQDYYYEIDATYSDALTNYVANLKNEVPASDRFVSIDHNKEVFQRADKQLMILSKSISAANGLFADAEERLQVSEEIDYIRQLINKPKIRLAAFWETVKNYRLLQWLGIQTASVVVQQEASSAFAALQNLAHYLMSL